MAGSIGRSVAGITAHTAEGAAAGVAHAIAGQVDGAATGGARSIVGMFTDAVAQFGSRNAFMFNDAAAGGWKHMTFAEAGTRVEHLGEGLIKSGVKPGDKVAILANSRVEWGLADYATMGAGGVVVPIYQTNTAPQVLHVLKDSGASHLIVEDAEQLAKLNEIRHEVPGLKNVFIMDPAGVTGGATPLADVERVGREAGTGAWKAHADTLAPDDLATIIYTSGTTGNPKGSMLTHRNYNAVVDALAGAENVFNKDDRVALFLPLAHTFARSVNFAGAKIGMEVAYSTPKTLMADMAHMKPTILPSVPRIFEKANAAIGEKLAAQTGVKALLTKWALKTGKQRYEAVEAGREVGLILGTKHRIADKLVLSKIREPFGGELRLAFSGGAPLDQNIQRFFGSAGIPIHDAYGLTEAPAVSMNLPGASRIGTVGRALPGTEVMLGEGNELLVRGPQVFKGYYNNAAKTAEALDSQGWLHTGDMVEISEDGFIRITGRIKDLIKTSGGKYVQPAQFEMAMKANPFISQAVMYGDGKPYVTALVTLNEAEVTKWAAAHGINGNMHDIASHPDVQKMVDDAIAAYNKPLDPPEQIKKFRILDSDLTAEAGEITPTLKVKRNVVSETFKPQLEAMYAEDAPAAGVISRG